MEGDAGSRTSSHRVAAILQGLEESGVVLTMLNRPREQMNRREVSRTVPAVAAVRPVVLERCSVETNTDHVPRSDHCSNREVQISDDRYTSCYQVAHCSVRPTSPPVTVSEFPPQRSTPNYFEGNFEVGGSGSCDRNEYTRSIRIRRGMITSPDRRYMYGGVPNCDTEAFAHSLRRYPSYPIFRTVSSEMVAKLQRSLRKHPILSATRTSSNEMLEKILRQTQANLSPETSMLRTSSIRSFKKERLSKWKQPKYMQTYSKTQDIRETRRAERTRNHRREDEENSRRYVSASNDVQQFSRRSRWHATSHPQKRTEDPFSTMYDYLRPSQPTSPYNCSRTRRSERDIRIEEIRRHVRETIRDIYNQRSIVFPMCSKVQRRYEEHKKQCTARGTDSKVSYKQQKQASSSGLCRLLEFLGNFVSPDPCDISMSDPLDRHQRTKASQYYEHESGCTCGPESSHPKSVCDCRPPYGEEISCYKIEDEIREWVTEIPVRNNEKVEDKELRNEMIENLIQTLETLLYDDDFEENVRDAVTKCVNNLPMWSTGSEQKRAQLKSRLIQTLLNRILPKPVNKVSQEIKNFFDALTYKYQVNTQKLTDDVLNNLRKLTKEGTQDDEFKYLFITDLHQILEKLPIKVDGNKNEVLYSLSNNLAIKIIELQIDNTLELSNEVSSSKGLASSAKNKRRPCSLLGPCKQLYLRPFHNRTESPQHICDSDTCIYKMNKKAYICDCCPNSTEKTSCTCEANTNRVRYPCDCDAEGGEYFNQSIDEEVDNWLNEIPVPINESAGDIKARKHKVMHLAEALKQLPDDSHFKKNAKEMIEKCVNSISMWYPDNKHDQITLKRQFTDLLLDRITAINRQPDKLTVIVKKFVYSVDFGDNNVNKKMLISNLIKKLKCLTSIPEVDDTFKEVLISEIRDILEQLLPQLDDSKHVYVETLAKKFADEIKENLSSIDTYANEIANLKEGFVKTLSDWVDDISELSEIPPNMKEVKKVIDELSTKLVALQSTGIDKFIIKNMENEIQKSLKKLNISFKGMDNVIEHLMDTVTDMIYAKEKTKLEAVYRQEIYKELREWLTTKEEIDDLSPQEQYSLIKEIVDKIETAQAEGQEDHQDLILETLTKAGVDISPDLQLEERLNRLKTFSTRNLETSIKDNIEKNMNDTIDSLNISEASKGYLKDKLRKEIEKNITISSMTTKKAVENMNEILLEIIDGIVDASYIPKSIQTQLKDNLADILNKNLQQVILAKDKDTIIYKLLKDINYNIDKENINDTEKNNLKYKLQHMFNESLAMPFSNYIKDHVFENIDRIISEAPIERNIKNRLTNKLVHVAQEKFHAIPTESVKDYIKDKIIKDMEIIIQKASLKEDAKNDLNQTLKYIINENFKQPYSVNIKDTTLEQINDTINDFLIPDTIKRDLLKKITTVVSNNLDDLPHQTDIDHAKETIAYDINDVIDNFSIPKVQAVRLKDDLGRVLAEYLDRPYSDSEKDKLIEEISKLINETHIPFDMKSELTFKLLDTITKRLDNLAHQSAEEYAKESILKEIIRMIDQTSISNSQKEVLRYKFEDSIENCFPYEHLDALKNMTAESVRAVIYDSSIPASEQNDLVDKMVDIINKILDETFYDDNMRAHLQGMFGMIEKDAPLHETYKDVLKNELKSVYDKYLQDPDLLRETFANTSSYEGLDANTETKLINDISDAINETQIPLNQKTKLENKLKKIFDTNRPIDLNYTIKELFKTIEQLPIFWQDKKSLKSKLDGIQSSGIGAEKMLKHVLLDDIKNAINLEPISEKEKHILKNKFTDVVIILNEPISNQTEDIIKRNLYKVVDESEFPKEQKRCLKDKITKIIRKLTTREKDENFIKEKILKHATEAVDGARIRSHLKKGLRAQLKKVLSENFGMPLKRDIISTLKHDFDNIIDDVPITTYQRNNLKMKLTDILSKELEQLSMNTDDARDIFLLDIDKIIEEKSLTNVNKAELSHKLRKSVLMNRNEPLSDKVKNQIRQNIIETIDKEILPKEKKNNLKEELDNALTKNFRVLSDHLKPADLLNSLVRNICNAIKDAPISQENKRVLKKKIQDNLPQTLQEPISDDLGDKVNNELFKTINEVPISQAQKRVLKNFLSNIVSGIVHEHQLRVLKHEIKDNLIQDANYVIEKLVIPKERKKQLKSNLKNVIDECFEKPLTIDQIKEIKQNIYKVIADVPLTKEKKAELRHNLTDVVDKHTKSLSTGLKPDTIVVKSNEKSKRNIWQKIDSVLNMSQIPTDDKKYIKQRLESVTDDISQLPPEVIRQNINIILDDIDIPKSKKTEIGDKLYDKLVNGLTQISRNYRQEGYLGELDESPNKLQKSSAPKNNLMYKVDDLSVEYLDKPPSIINIVSEMPNSRNNKYLLNNKTDLLKPKPKDKIMDSTVTIVPKKTSKNTYLSPAEEKISTREDNTVFDDVQMPKEQKKDLRCSLKKIVPETLDTPLTTNIGESDKIGEKQIIDVPIQAKEQKIVIKSEPVDNKNKPIIGTRTFTESPQLGQNFTNNTFQEQKQMSTPTELLKDTYLSTSKKEDALRKIDTTLTQLKIPKGQMKDLKLKIENMVSTLLERPLCTHTNQAVKDEINKIINDSPVFSSDKNIIITKLHDIVDNDIRPLTETYLQHTKVSKKNEDKKLQSNDFNCNYKSNSLQELSHNIDAVLESIPISNDKKIILAKLVNDAVTITKSSPHIQTDIFDNINTVIGNTTLPKSQKVEVKNKLFDLVNSARTANTLLSSSKKSNEQILNKIDTKVAPIHELPNIKTNTEQVKNAINALHTSVDLKSKLKDIIQTATDDNTMKTVDSLKDSINKEIAKASLPKEKKNEIQNTLIKSIDENIAQILPLNDKKNHIMDTVIRDINRDLNAAQIPNDVKVILKDKIEDKLKSYLDTPQSIKTIENVKEDINNIINETPILDNKALYNTSNTTTMRYEDATNEANKAKATHSRSQDDESMPTGIIYDADDDDSKDRTSIRMPLRKGSKETVANSKRTKFKETMFKELNGVIDGFDIPRNKRTDLKLRLNGVTSSNIDKLFVTPQRDLSNMKKAMQDKIDQVIDEAPSGPAFTKQTKNNMKDQLSKVVNKNVDFMITENVRGTNDSKIVLNTIDRLPVPEHVKEELRKKMLKSPEVSINGSQDSKRSIGNRDQDSRRSISSRDKVGWSSHISPIPEEGPITSTPMAGAGRPVGLYSTLGDESVMQALSPEDRDFWINIQDAISNWLDALPIDLDDETKKAIKQALASDILDRQQYLLLNPGARKPLLAELEDLQYQVFRRLGKVLSLEEMQVAMQEAVKLMQMMTDVEQPVDTDLNKSEEIKLHQQFMDVISETMPEKENASSESILFEMMKEDLADAFIKLHYAGGDEEELNNLRDKINDEIDKFCTDYLSKYPDKPLDREKLKRDLYKALKELEPSDDLMKYAVEHVRLKNVTYEWLSELPLERQIAAEKLKTKKKAAFLAKQLLDLEQNHDNLSHAEVKDKMEKAITKFLLTLPLKTGQEKNIPAFTAVLIDRLNRTKEYRALDVSTRHSVTLEDFMGSSWLQSYPPCTLTSEDLEHLAIIKKRACLAPRCIATLRKANENKRNAAVSPMSMECAAQTETSCRLPPCPSFSPTPKVCPGMPLDPHCSMQFIRSSCTQSLSHMDLQPQIIIKEYYWNSSNTAELQTSDSRLLGGAQRRAHFAYRPPCIQKSSQTCQDKAIGSRSPCSPYPFTPFTCTTSPCNTSPCNSSAQQPPRTQSRSASLCNPSPCIPFPCTTSACAPPSCNPSLFIQSSHTQSRSASPCTPSPCSPFSCNSSPVTQSPDAQSRYAPSPSSLSHCTPRLFNPRCCTPTTPSPCYNPCQHSNQTSFCNEEPRYRKIPIIQLGSLDQLRNPSQKERRLEDLATSTRNLEAPENLYSNDDEVEIHVNRGKKQESVICKCKSKPTVNTARARWKQDTRKDRAILATSNENAAMKKCLKCCGIHCPYPSFMYFRQ